MVKNKIMLVIRNFSFIKLLIFILLLLPMQVLADNVYMTCNQDVITKDSVSCSIKGNTTTTTIAVSLKVQTGSNITFKSFTPSSVWQGDGEDGNVDLYTANDILGKYDIGTLNLNVESLYQGLDTSITLYSVSVYDRDGKETKLDNYTKKIRIASNDNTLSSLNITSGLLNPTFSSNITTYSATVNTDRITINATANNDKAKVEGDIGTKKLNYGNNTFKINVLSESQETKTYTININRLNNENTTTNNSGNTNNQSNNVQKSSNNYLKDIKLSYGNITLENDKFEYDLNIPYDIDSIEKVINSYAGQKLFKDQQQELFEELYELGINTKNKPCSTMKAVNKWLSNNLEVEYEFISKVEKSRNSEHRDERYIMIEE